MDWWMISTIVLGLLLLLMCLRERNGNKRFRQVQQENRVLDGEVDRWRDRANDYAKQVDSWHDRHKKHMDECVLNPTEEELNEVFRSLGVRVDE